MLSLNKMKALVTKMYFYHYYSDSNKRGAPFINFTEKQHDRYYSHPDFFFFYRFQPNIQEYQN